MVDAWKKTGKIEAFPGGLLVTVQGFNQEVLGVITRETAAKMIRDRVSVPIIKIRVGIDGSEIVEDVGRAWRSRSGKGVIISMSAAGGESSGSWKNFLDLVSGEKRHMVLGYFEELKPPFREPALMKAAVNGDIRAGLDQRF